MSEKQQMTSWQDDEGRVADKAAAEFAARAERAPRDEILRQKEILRSKVITHVKQNDHNTTNYREEYVDSIIRHQEKIEELENKAKTLGDVALMVYQGPEDFDAQRGSALHPNFGLSDQNNHRPAQAKKG